MLYKVENTKKEGEKMTIKAEEEGVKKGMKFSVGWNKIHYVKVAELRD